MPGDHPELPVLVALRLILTERTACCTRLSSDPDKLRGLLPLLGMVWPKERVVLGLTVCRWLHAELLSQVPETLLNGYRIVFVCWCFELLALSP